MMMLANTVRTGDINKNEAEQRMMMALGPSCPKTEQAQYSDRSSKPWSRGLGFGLRLTN